MLYLKHKDISLRVDSATTFKDVKTWTKGFLGGINFGFFSRASTHPKNSYAVGHVRVNGENIVYSPYDCDHFHALYKQNGTIKIGRCIPPDCEWGITAGPRLIANGRICEGQSGGLDDPRWPAGGVSFTTKKPRVAVGIHKDGDIILAYSDSTTPRELAQELLEFGCVEALGGDGGSSATFVDYTKDVYRGGQYVPNALYVPVPYTKPIIEKVDVVLDPGHGGSDPGAISDGCFEKDFNLSSCRNMKKYLERAGLQVALTRDGDYDTTLEGVCKFSNDRNAKVYYCKHHNWYGKAEVSGREYFTFPGSERGLKLATLIEEHVKIATSQPLRRIAQTGFYVLKHTDAPAVLDEGGFMTNTGDLALMKDSQWMDRRDFAASLGIIEYLKGSG